MGAKRSPFYRTPLFKQPAPKPKTASELEFHLAVAQFLDVCLAPPAMYTTFPSGWDVMSKSRAGKLKGAGLVAGMPDILVFDGGRCIGLELKSFNGRLSTEQKMTHHRLDLAGVRCFTCRTIEQIATALREMRFPMRSVKIVA